MERRETGARLGAESAGSNSSIPLLKAGGIRPGLDSTSQKPSLELGPSGVQSHRARCDFGGHSMGITA